MGLLDQLAGQFLGGNSAGGDNPLLQMAAHLLQNHEGGLAGVIAQLNQGGLAEQVKSWIGSGANLPVSADQLSSALGPDTLAKLAGTFGVAPEQVAGQLAQSLPHLVDHLSPDGSLEGGEALLAKGLGSLFGS